MLSGGFLGPEVFADEPDVPPSKRRDKGEKMIRRIDSFATPSFCGMAEMQGILANDDSSERIEAGDLICPR